MSSVPHSLNHLWKNTFFGSLSLSIIPSLTHPNYFSQSKPDRDMDVDDMFVDKAARKQSEAETFSKDRASAIFEHRKLNAAMEKCPRCFDKVPKHLIVAIGSRSYLCLPPHRSLTEGHCFIVPMQVCMCLGGCVSV